jgi:hypothetical protein
MFQARREIASELVDEAAAVNAGIDARRQGEDS